jgi:hypothetical protein
MWTTGAGHVVRVGKMRNACKILVGVPEGCEDVDLILMDQDMVT